MSTDEPAALTFNPAIPETADARRRSRLKRLVQRDQAVLQGEDGGLSPVGEPEFGEDAGHVTRDGLLGDR